MKNKKNYIYISEPFMNTVLNSQVANLLELLDKEDIVFDLVITTPLKYLLFNNKLRKKNIKHIKSTIKGKVYQIPVIKSNDKTGISSLIKFIFLYFKYRRSDSIVIQTRSIKDYLALYLFKYFKNGIKIIFDYRGAVAEEFINGKGYKSVNLVNNKKIIKKYNSIIKEQDRMFTISSKIFCVSNKLEKYLNKISKNKFKKKLNVIPGGADSNHFFYDLKIRNINRQKLNLCEDNIVFVYSGRLDSFYINNNFLFELIKNILLKIPNSIFLCLTPNLDLLNEIIINHKIPMSKVIGKHVHYNEINDYLNASDIGLMIREKIMTNYVASPTKIPEYLMSGLPIVISEDIGDYSDFVLKNNLGLVTGNDISKIINKIEKINELCSREDISKIVKQSYSKQSYLKKIINIYNEQVN
tara:strand:+ start:82 stop:1317 length:1236 start_codon:yes stop_codon:yes gene_type:complete